MSKVIKEAPLEIKVEEKRKEQLEKFKIAKIAYLKDKIDTINMFRDEEIANLAKKIEEVENMKFIPTNEGEPMREY